MPFLVLFMEASHFFDANCITKGRDVEMSSKKAKLFLAYIDGSGDNEDRVIFLRRLL